MDGHRIYLRLPPRAALSADQHAGCVSIECPAAELDELCKWLRLTADSLDGKLSASELGHLQRLVDEQSDMRGTLNAIKVCQEYAREHPAEAATAILIAKQIADGTPA